MLDHLTELRHVVGYFLKRYNGAPDTTSEILSEAKVEFDKRGYEFGKMGRVVDKDMYSLWDEHRKTGIEGEILNRKRPRVCDSENQDNLLAQHLPPALRNIKPEVQYSL